MTQNDSVSIIDKNDNGELVGGYLQSQFKFFDDRLKIVTGRTR